MFYYFSLEYTLIKTVASFYQSVCQKNNKSETGGLGSIELIKFWKATDCVQKINYY